MGPNEEHEKLHAADQLDAHEAAHGDFDAEGQWIDAPASSHIKAMRFTNRYFSSGTGPSIIWVTFRSRTSVKTGNVTPETTYRYESMDHIGLRQTFEKMIIAGSPGEILHADLISKDNPGIPS